MKFSEFSEFAVATTADNILAYYRSSRLRNGTIILVPSHWSWKRSLMALVVVIPKKDGPKCLAILHTSVILYTSV